MDPLTSAAHEKKFLDACKALFMRGILLGCDEEYQVPTAANNYLARGVLKYFVDTQRPLMAAEFFKDYILFVLLNPQLQYLVFSFTF